MIYNFLKKDIKNYNKKNVYIIEKQLNMYIWSAIIMQTIKKLKLKKKTFINTETQRRTFNYYKKSEYINKKKKIMIIMELIFSKEKFDDSDNF